MNQLLLKAIVFLASWFWAIIPLSIWGYFHYKEKARKKELSSTQKALKKGAIVSFWIFLILKILGFLLL